MVGVNCVDVSQIVNSIPIWSDFSRDSVNELLRFRLISIPIWSDFSGLIFKASNISRYISIPIWSDFSIRPYGRLNKSYMNFNPNMV